MDIELIRIIQGYAYWAVTILLVVILYAYIFHIYRSEKRGEKDYEKYGRLALDDELDDEIVEAMDDDKSSPRQGNAEAKMTKQKGE